MNGRTQTYVKSSKRRRLTYTFRLLNRFKSVELNEFIQSYNSDVIRLLNWKGEVWKVNFMNNPFDFIKTGRSDPGGPRSDILLEFEGERIQ